MAIRVFVKKTPGPPPSEFAVYSVGVNTIGNLAVGDTSSRSTLTQVGSETIWATAAVSTNNGAFIKNDGTLWTVGGNFYGTLGIGVQGNSYAASSPVQVGALTDWEKIEGGRDSFHAIKTDGTLWAWGQDNAGELGRGSSGATARISSPVQIGSDTDWDSVFKDNSYNTALIKTDGSLWVCGQNSPYGQLGFGDVISRSVPTQLGSDTNWEKVSWGSAFSIFLKTTGTIWSCGVNSYGQLGQGDSGNGTHRSSPVQIGALTTWSDIACGYEYTLAVKTDGTLWAWGRNNYGQLGQGDITNVSSPVQIGALTDWLYVNCGRDASYAIKSDGTLWAWGNNAYGQLGQDDITHRSSPVQVGSVDTWNSISTVEYFLYALD